MNMEANQQDGFIPRTNHIVKQDAVRKDDGRRMVVARIVAVSAFV